MTLEDQIRTLRKQAGLSQEKLAELTGVSRQAVTKWESGTGVPDIANLVSIAELFGVSLDELLLDKKASAGRCEYLYESVTEYDIDGKKRFDIRLGGASEAVLRACEGEKVQVRLCSNTVPRLRQDYKVKIDDQKTTVDIDVLRYNDATEKAAKDGIFVTVALPSAYIRRAEIDVHTKRLKIVGLGCEAVEATGKIEELILEDCKGSVEIDCDLDMQVYVRAHEGVIELNQISSASKITVPKGYAFQASQKGIATRITYEKNGRPAGDFSSAEAENCIRLNGVKSELIIAEAE